MNPLKIAAMAGLFLFASDPSSAASSSVPADFKLSLERQACFGFCPMYTVSVNSKGEVTYVGERFVKLKGTYKAQLSPVQLERLYKVLERANVYQYRSAYKTMSVTDLPSAILKVSALRRSKTIDHYFGDKTAPQSLSRLENEVDRLIGTRKWVGTGIYRE